MNLILFTRCHQKPLMLRLGQPACYLPVVVTFVLLCGGLFGAGYWIGQVGGETPVAGAGAGEWQQELERQKELVAETRAEAQARIDQLTRRVGQLQAHVMRLDALGQRLTHMASLDSDEFDFSKQPALGGPEELPAPATPGVESLVEEMESLDALLQDREQQLAALESLLLYSNLDEQVSPEGRPIRQGWLSSYYGKRADPFTGKQDYHAGMDFAGKLGSDVVAVATGVVVFSGKRYGYGNMVEIDHGNGYVTRYGHNQENLVKVGDKVEKGQVIARMGSSGRSTGPHVHFEVLRNGRKVDPARYIAAAR